MWPADSHVTSIPPIALVALETKFNGLPLLLAFASCPTLGGGTAQLGRSALLEEGISLCKRGCACCMLSVGCLHGLEPGTSCVVGGQGMGHLSCVCSDGVRRSYIWF